MVSVRMRAKGQPGVEVRAQIQCQMVLFHKFLQIGSTQVLFLLAVGILKIKMVKAELVRHDDHPVIRHSFCNPMMAANGLQPPDFIGICKGHSIGFIGSVLLQQGTGTQNALPRRADVRKNQCHQILFPDSARNLFGAAPLLRLIAHIGVSAQHPGIAGNRFRRRHGHIGLIDAAGRPHAVFLVHIGAIGIAHGIPRKLHRQMGNHCFVCIRRFLCGVNQNTLGFKTAIIISCNDGRAVIACFFTNQNCCTGHIYLLSF